MRAVNGRHKIHLAYLVFFWLTEPNPQAPAFWTAPDSSAKGPWAGGCPQAPTPTCWCLPRCPPRGHPGKRPGRRWSSTGSRRHLPRVAAWASAGRRSGRRGPSVWAEPSAAWRRARGRESPEAGGTCPWALSASSRETASASVFRAFSRDCTQACADRSWR